MTRIPQLEQELVAAAARLQTPRRLVRPAVRAVLAVAAVLAVIAIAVVLAGDNDSDRRPQPAGGLPSPPNANKGNRTKATLTARQEIERIGNKWAPLYAASPSPDPCAGFDEAHPNGEFGAKYVGQPACEHAICERVGHRPIENCTPLPPGYQKSFADARVQLVKIKKGAAYRAAARFSNGEVVEFFGDGGRWGISKVGGNAGRGFFR